MTEITLPEYDTVGHYVLHSIMRHCTRSGLDYRPASEIASGMRHPRQEVVDALADLQAAGVIEVADQGLRLLAKCNCKVARPGRSNPQVADSTLGQFVTPANVQVRDNFEQNSRTDLTEEVMTRRLRLQESVFCKTDSGTASADNNFPIDPTEVGEWRGLPGHMKGTRLAKPIRSREVNPDTGMGLARYFNSKCREAGIGKGAPPTHFPALAKSLNRTLADDIDPAQVRAMVDRFVVNPAWSRGKTPWKVFLSRRPELLEATKRFKPQPERGTQEWKEGWAGKPKLTYEEALKLRKEINRKRELEGEQP